MNSSIFVVDVEAAGRTPMRGTLTEIGVADLSTRQWFHGIFWDTHPDPEIPAIPVPERENARWATGKSKYDLKDGVYTHAASGKELLKNLTAWLEARAAGKRITLMSDNPFYDGMWTACAYDAAGLTNPFGHSARRIGDYAAGVMGAFNSTSKWKQLRDVKHSHLAHEDAQGNVGALRALQSMEAQINVKAKAQEAFTVSRRKRS